METLQIIQYFYTMNKLKEVNNESSNATGIVLGGWSFRVFYICFEWAEENMGMIVQRITMQSTYALKSWRKLPLR